MAWLINAVAALVVLVLGALAVGPHLVDWNGWRASIAAQAEGLLGMAVAIGGDAEVQLLPSPRLVLSDVRVGPVDAPILVADRVALNMSLIPLINGDVHINELVLTRPVVALRIGADGGLDLPARTRTGPLAGWIAPDRIVVDAIAVDDLAVTVGDDRTGTTRTVVGIDLSGSARSLAGPFAATGMIPAADGPVAISVQGGVMAGGALPLSVRATGPRAHPAFGFDGLMSPSVDAPSLAGRVRLSAAGDLPWTVEASLAADPSALVLSEATATLGVAAVPLELSGTATYAPFGRDPLAITLGASRIDLDRIEHALTTPVLDPVAAAVAVTAEPTPPTPRPSSAVLARLLAGFGPAAGALGAAGIPVTAELDIGTVLSGGSVVRDVSVDLAAVGNGPIDLRAEALLPGDALAEAEGEVAGGRFAGHVRLSAPQPAALMRWWRGTPVDATLAPLQAEADLDVGPARFDARRVSLRIGDSVAGGSVRWEAGVLDVRLDAPFVDIADVAPVAAMGRLAMGTLPAASAVALSLAAERLRLGGVDGTDLSVRADFRGGTLTVDALSAGSVAGAQLFAAGTIADLFGSPVGSIEGTVSLSDGDALAGSLGRFLPDARFRAAIPHLAPGELRVALSGGAEAGLSATLSGMANGSTLDLTLAGDLFGDVAQADARIAARLDNPDGALLLRQLGLPGGDVQGPGRLNLNAAGTPAEGMTTDAALAFPAGTLTAGGTFTATDGDLRFDGTVAARTEQLAAAGRAFGLTLPNASADLRAQATGDAAAVALAGVSGRIDGSAVSGDLVVGETIAGSLRTERADLARLAARMLGEAAVARAEGWPVAVFGPPMVPPRPVALALTVDRLAVGRHWLQDVRTDLAFDGSTVALSGLSAGLAGGRLTGAVTLVRDGARAELDARLQLAEAQLSALPWTEAGRPVLAGRIDADVGVAASGYTLSGLVQALRGSGRVVVADGSVALNSAPFVLPAAMLDAAAAPSEADAVAALDAHLAGATRVDRLDGRLEVTGGVVSLAGIVLQSSVPLVVEEASVDLDGWQAKAVITLPSSLVGSERAPLSLSFAGPLSSPRRTVDAASLATFIDLSRLARQVETVERDNRTLEAEANARGTLAAGTAQQPGPAVTVSPALLPTLSPPGDEGAAAAGSRVPASTSAVEPEAEIGASPADAGTQAGAADGPPGGAPFIPRPNPSRAPFQMRSDDGPVRPGPGDSIAGYFDRMQALDGASRRSLADTPQAGGSPPP